MKNFFRTTLYSLIVFLLITCSSSENIDGSLSLSVINNDVNAWLNLMPGSSHGTFHFAGELTLKNIEDVEIKNIELSSVEVYLSDEIIYSVVPYFNPKFKEDDYSLKTDLEKDFVFGSANNLKVNKKLEKQNIINLKLNFISDERSYNLTIDEIEIERTY